MVGRTGLLSVRPRALAYLGSLSRLLRPRTCTYSMQKGIKTRRLLLPGLAFFSSLFLQQDEVQIAHPLPIHLHLQNSTGSWGLVGGFRTQIQIKRTNWTHLECAPWWCALFVGKVPKEMYSLHHAALETAFKVNKNESTRNVEVIKLALCFKNNVLLITVRLYSICH